MGRFWSLFFLLVPILGVGTFALAPAYHHWLPEDVSIAGEGNVVDSLFYFILYLTGLVFVGTEVVLFWFMWKYDGANNAEPAKYSHGNHSLEIIWTIIPAGTLLFIAIYQMNAWANQTMRPPANPGLECEVTARQFEWRIKYPGPDGKLGTFDDIHTVNDLHIPAYQPVLMHLKSQDVLHSFFLPHLRVKQDAVPGMTIPVWYTAVKPGAYDLVCAELCGWGHYKMKGRLTVQSREDFDRWLAELRNYQESEK